MKLPPSVVCEKKRLVIHSDGDFSSKNIIDNCVVKGVDGDWVCIDRLSVD